MSGARWSPSCTSSLNRVPAAANRGINDVCIRCSERQRSTRHTPPTTRWEPTSPPETTRESEGWSADHSLSWVAAVYVNVVASTLLPAPRERINPHLMTMINTGVETTKPLIQTYLVAEVKCYMCGAISGTVESDRQPLPRSVMFRAAGDQQAIPVLDWHRLRCVRCAGPVYLDEADLVTRRVETHNWLDERPRRGRPPKRLVEERRRQRELLEQHAA